MIGSALGDAIGEIAQHNPQYSIDEIFKEYEQLKYTDDTAQAIAVSKYILNQDYSTKTLGDAFLKAINEEPDRGYGGTRTIFYIAELNNISYEEARERYNEAFNNGEGNWGDGGAMRIHPAALFFNDRSNFKEMITMISALDHSHPIAIDGTLLCAKLISLILQNKTIDKYDVCEVLIDYAKTTEIKNNMMYIKEALEQNISASVVDSLTGNNSRSEINTWKVVPYAIFSFLSYLDSYGDCLNTAISTNGDADTIGAIACSFSRAYLGIDAIPEEWITKLENQKGIQLLANKLYESKIKNGIKK